MTNNLALAASAMMLIAISGSAYAATSNAHYSPEAVGASGRQVAYAFNAFDSAVATQADEFNAYRYHGGPKSND